jgi:hypothetical protein
VIKRFIGINFTFDKEAILCTLIVMVGMKFLTQQRLLAMATLIGAVIMFIFASCVSEPSGEIIIEEESGHLEEDMSIELPSEDISEAGRDSQKEYAVTEAVYEEVFTDIEKLIEEMNRIIATQDFEKWKYLCTLYYLDYYSRKDVLDEISEKPLLKKYNIHLKTLHDYFSYVVVPSRANVRLDEIVFIDQSHLKAYMYIMDKKAVLYYLEKTEGQWLIGIQ